MENKAEPLQVFLARQLDLVEPLDVLTGSTPNDEEEDFTLKAVRPVLNEEIIQHIRRYYEIRGYEVEVTATRFGFLFSTNKNNQELFGTVTNESDEDSREISVSVSITRTTIERG